jgi:hypothetical protein
MTPEQQDLQNARDAVNTSREAIPGALWVVAEAQRVLDEAKSRGASQSELDGKQQALDDARDDLEEVRSDLAMAKAELANLLATYVSPSVTPAMEIDRLEANVPIVFLPVRIETRFAPGKLRIRVYPDDIFGSTHEKAITQTEIDAAVAFQATGNTLEGWQAFIQGRTPQRAAWVYTAWEQGGFDLKDDNWTIPSEATLLPDRWIALGVRPDGTVEQGLGTPIQEPLQLSYDPRSNDQGGTGPLPVEAALKWTVDFDTAKQAGMALEIDADASGFDRLLVFGVKGSMSPTRSAEALRELLRDHRYSRGMAVVQQGTPTNNTGGRDAGYPLDDRGGEVSYRVDWEAGLDGPETDGRKLTSTLGLPELPFRPFRDVFGADGKDQKNAEQMNRALFPASFGYFLQHMMDPVTIGKTRIFEDDDVHVHARSHFVNYVRGRGTCPAFRIGAVPYGVLPVSSLAKWKSPTTTGLDGKLPPKLELLRTLWLNKAVTGAARINRNPNDPDGDLLSVIGLHPSTRQVRVRKFAGDSFQRALFQLLRRPWGPWASALLAMAKKSFDLIGEGANWNLRIGRASANASADLFKYPLVAPEPLSEELDANGQDFDLRGTPAWQETYIDFLARATTAEMLKNGPPSIPQALLYHVLRHSVLTEWARLAYEETLEQDKSRTILELIGIITGTDTQKSIWDRFTQMIGSKRVEELVQEKADAQSLKAALQHLAPLSQAELERLFSETLDVASHRLDAWITSIFAKRLEQQRAAGASAELSYLGAFAWVEDLRPASSTSVPGGFIHAPSMAHAATAGILRSGFLTRKGESAARFSFDLSSDRVRVARELLEAVRNGQPAGAVLGYRFERALHDGSLDRFIDPLRKKYPLVANKAQQGSEDAAAVAARSVVDGLALRLAWQTRTSDDAFIGAIGVGPPAPSPAEKAALVKALEALDEAVDGVGDLLTAESVFQMVRGNAPGAAAPLDALAAGAHPPDPEVARTPRGGIGVVHRMMYLWSHDPGADDGDWSNDGATPTPAAVSTRRAEADRLIDDWAGELLGRPQDALCWVTYTEGGTPQRKPISFQALKVRPADVLALAEDSAENREALNRRIIHAATGISGVNLDDIAVDFEPDSDDLQPLTQKTFPELLALARQINGLLARARPGRPVDLLPVDGSDPPPLSPREVSEFTTASTFLGDVFERDLETLTLAIQNGDEEQLITALKRAAEYAATAFPDARETEPELRARAERVEPELTRRHQAAQKIIDDNTADEDKTPEKALEIYRAIFGPAFLRLPRFTLATSVKEEIEASIGGLSKPPKTHQPAKFLQQNGRVRPALAAWRRLWLHAASFKKLPGPTVDVAQIPFVPGEKWAGDDGVPGGQRLSLLLARTGARADLTAGAAALVIDDFTEVIPAAEEQTGLAFHYDNPGAEAAQAILVGVCPEISATKTKWTFDEVKATLNETFDLAKIRAVEPALIGETQQVLPALYLTANTAGETVTTSFANLLQAEPVHVPR